MGDEATEQSLGEFSFALPEPSNSPRSEPDSQEPLLCIGGWGWGGSSEFVGRGMQLTSLP